MSSMLMILFPVVPLSIVSFSCAWLALYLYKKQLKGRRSPLTGKLLRSPGHTLISQIDELNEGINTDLMMFFISIFIFTNALPHLYRGEITSTVRNIALFFLILLPFALFFIRRLSKRLQLRNLLRLGLDAEMAVGQELNHLMRHGCYVYHDFPAEEFNIDHVVIGPSGVIAVETKGRAKPDKGRGTADAQVIYDGKDLQFPDWHERKPLDQARRQADWLAKWLSGAIGEPVAVKPALALAGWFVKRTQPGDVAVYNGKSPFFLARPQGTPLTDTIIKRIAHQVEQRCRDVEPGGYRKDKKK